MVIRTFFIFAIFVVSGVCHSQHWLLRVKPIIGTPLASFQRFDKVVYDPVINYSNGYKPISFLFTDNVKLRLQYNLELFADVYELNPNWRVGAGFGVYNGGVAFLSVESGQQNSKYVTDNEIILGNSIDKFRSTIGPVDFNMYTLATRKLNFEINKKDNVLQFISLGAGFTKNKKNDRTWIWNPVGLFVSETYKSHNYFPFLLLRYELEFINKKGKNLFSCALNYQQGIFKKAKFTHYDIYNAGSFDYQSTITRGSSIGVSINKPFYLKRKKTTKTSTNE